MYYVILTDSCSEITDIIECQSMNHALCIIRELYEANIHEEDVDIDASYLHVGYAKIVTKNKFYEYRMAKA